MGTKIYLLDGGNHKSEKSICVLNTPPGVSFTMQVYTAYIDHPEAKIVVDTSLDLAYLPGTPFQNWNHPQTDSQKLPNALKSLGVKPEDIDIVINTHLHVDHCSYNKLFTKATWLVQEKELLNALAPEKWENGYIKAAVQSAVLAGLRPEMLNGDYNVAKGVNIVSTPGHTNGHQSVAVETDGGVYVLTGDLCYVKENFVGSERTSPEGWPPGACNDKRENMDSLRRLKKFMAETQARTMKTCVPLFSHDGEEFPKWKHAPEYY
jgi:glyoxylase-like metal-dependent hydrolase (beta-lactamase superfamily II)